jgi:hypothetical protein
VVGRELFAMHLACTGMGCCEAHQKNIKNAPSEAFYCFFGQKNRQKSAYTNHFARSFGFIL